MLKKSDLPAMNDPFTAEVTTEAGMIGNIVHMGKKHPAHTTHLLQPLNQAGRKAG